MEMAAIVTGLKVAEKVLPLVRRSLEDGTDISAEELRAAVERREDAVDRWEDETGRDVPTDDDEQ